MKVIFEGTAELHRQTQINAPERKRQKAALGKLFILAVLVCFCTPLCVCIAQAQSLKAPDDRAPMTVRYPDKAHLSDLQTAHDYQYGNDAPPPENPIARFFAWLWSKLGEFLSSEAYQNVWQYVILAAVAGLAIYLLMKADMLDFLFPKKAQSSGLDYENIAENIHEIDFDAAIDDAVAKGNYRLGVRLLYLQTLKRLADAGLIAYKPEKTNRQYVYELVNTPLQTDFEGLTRQFEMVWYGDFPVSTTQFADLQTGFRAFDIATQPKRVH